MPVLEESSNKGWLVWHLLPIALSPLLPFELSVIQSAPDSILAYDTHYRRHSSGSFSSCYWEVAFIAEEPYNSVLTVHPPPTPTRAAALVAGSSPCFTCSLYLQLLSLGGKDKISFPDGRWIGHNMNSMSSGWTTSLLQFFPWSMLIIWDHSKIRLSSWMLKEN